MAIKSGLANFSTKSESSLNNTIPSIDEGFQSFRVKDIILDNTHPKFKQYGEWNGIGTIEFEPITKNSGGDVQNPIATPLVPYLKNYPLVNEIVVIFKLINRNISQTNDTPSFYYLNSLSLWNHPHHNAYPNVIHTDQTPESQTKDYQTIEGGSVRRVSNNSTELNLNSPKIGGTFIEKTNIHPLLPFAGDIIIEGRFGNSLRFGNTAKVKGTIKNNWSGGNSENGDPITILRNGQPQDSSEEGWIPIVENINKDLGSIYLTSTQQIPLSTGINNFPSITSNKPDTLAGYNKNQVILNSGRLVLNTNTDHIILNSSKSISLSSIEDIGLYSKNGNINLQANSIKLGDVKANQSLVLGDNFIQNFEFLLKSLSILCDTIASEPSLSVSPLAASSTKITIEKILKNIDSFLSKITKTI
tara:strand:- start:416 stop:1663 length:1248 start_codon:yes stop_codon:yes gene_type:complete